MRKRVFMAVAFAAAGVTAMRALAPEDPWPSVAAGELQASAIAGEADPSAIVRFDGFTGLVAGGTSTWRVRAQAAPASPARSYQLSLVAAHAGEAHAVSGHNVEVDGTPLSTDDGGWLRFDAGEQLRSQDGQALTVRTALPEGDYALLLRLVDERRVLVGVPQAVWFTVADARGEVRAGEGSEGITGGSTSSTTALPTTTAGTEVPATSSVVVRGLRLVPLPDPRSAVWPPAARWPRLRCTSSSCAGTPLPGLAQRE